MHDYRFIFPDGQRVPVAELPTPLIRYLLSDGVELDGADPHETPEQVMKRLDLELFIREKGLRT